MYVPSLFICYCYMIVHTYIYIYAPGEMYHMRTRININTYIYIYPEVHRNSLQLNRGALNKNTRLPSTQLDPLGIFQVYTRFFWSRQGT